MVMRDTGSVRNAGTLFVQFECELAGNSLLDIQFAYGHV